jgi:hypothetical protein
MNEWADVSDKGELIIDWDAVFELSLEYDDGMRDFDASLAKLISLVQRFSFERGFEEGIRANKPIEALLTMTMGNS